MRGFLVWGALLCLSLFSSNDARAQQCVPVNRVPVAMPDVAVTDEDTVLNVAAPGALSNDLDDDCNPLSAELLTAPNKGTVAFNPDGSFQYTPELDHNGTTSFEYRAFDGVDYSAPATVDITINPVNDSPFAVADFYAVESGTVLSVNVPGVLENDGDVDGDPLTAEQQTAPANGTAVMQPDGSFTYTSNPGFVGQDSFIYAANDASSIGVATVTIDVTDPLPPAPTVPPIAEVSVDCSNPDVIWSGGVGHPSYQVGDSTKTLRHARKDVPVGGVLGIRPGVYAGLPETNMQMPDSLTVCGLDPNDRPEVHLTGKWSMKLNNNGVRGDFVIANVEIVGEGITVTWPHNSLTVVDSYLHSTNKDCIAVGFNGEDVLQITLQDVEIADCGNSAKHNIYLAETACEVTALRLYSHSAYGSAFKSICRKNNIQDSVFLTTDDLTNTEVTGEIGDGRYWSHKLLDIAACAENYVKNNRFEAARIRSAGGTIEAVYFRARRDITGCNQPPFSNIDDPMTDFTDPAFWASPTPSEFRAVLVDNTFVWLGDLDGLNRYADAIKDDGTYPRNAAQQFSSCSVYQAVIAEWSERALVDEWNSTYVNWPVAERYNMDFAECLHADSDPRATYPLPARAHWFDGVLQ